MRSEDKITSEDALEEITNQLKNALRKTDAFGNNSLCFSGMDGIFAFRGFLHSRGDTPVDVDIPVKIGDLEAPVTGQVKTTGAVLMSKGGRPKGSKNKPQEED